jgi:putative resolvase
MLSINEASKLLGVTKRTLRNWEKKGKISPYRTPGGHRRYDKEELLKVMNINDQKI